MPRNLLRTLIVSLACLGIIVSVAFIGPAIGVWAVGPNIKLNITFGPPSALVKVNGTSFGANETVDLAFRYSQYRWFWCILGHSYYPQYGIAW